MIFFPLLAGMLFVTPEFCHLLFLVELTMALAECLGDALRVGLYKNKVLYQTVSWFPPQW